MFAEVVQLNEDYVGKQSVSPVHDRNKPPGRPVAPLKSIHCATHDEVPPSEETVFYSESAEQYPHDQTMQYAYESGSAPLQTNFYYEENGYNSPKQQGISQQRGQQSHPLWNPRQGQPNAPSPQSRGPMQQGYSQIMAKPHPTQQPQNSPGQVPAQQYSQAPIQYQNPQGPLVHNQQQARPAPQVGCYRCGSHEHYASSCPKPSKA